MKTGWDVGIHPDTLAGFDYAALGHIHRLQKVGGPKVKAWYAGSPEYIDFTEAGLEKAWVLVDVDSDSTLVDIIPTGARPMVQLDALAIGGEWSLEQIDPKVWAEGPLVRVIARADAKPSAKMTSALSRQIRKMGASFVRIDVVREVKEVARVDTVGLSVIEATEKYLEALPEGSVDVEAAMTEARRITTEEAA